jgi:hypothetical protein
MIGGKSEPKQFQAAIELFIFGLATKSRVEFKIKVSSDET